jgi:hypothetical protein
MGLGGPVMLTLVLNGNARISSENGMELLLFA